LDFDTVLDLFGGTGSVGYMYKTHGKKIFYNDYLACNYLTGKALIENSEITLSNNDITFILMNHASISYPNFVAKTFTDIYYTDEENKWLDLVTTNIAYLKNDYKKALAYFALFQACLVKRPYNLFHRKNLYVRLADVKRSFGNKTTWDLPFEKHFIKFVNQANNAVFNNQRNNKAYKEYALSLNMQADLIYIDTPYISKSGIGVEYIDFYHFLEGLCNYNNWANKIDYNSKHLKFKNKKSVWSNKDMITEAFDKLFSLHKKSIIVLSYRSDGIPSPEMLILLMKKYKDHVAEVFRGDYKYALSKNGDSKEILIVGK
jgi:adenine-specific DNA methylase